LYDGTLTDSIKEGLWVVWEKILGNDVDEQTNDDLINIINNMSAEADKHFDSSEIPTSEKVLKNRWEKVNKLNNQIKKTKPITFDDIIKGTRTVKLGQKGNIVTEIQNMLVSIGYYLGDTGKNKDGVDGDFGTLTETVVKYFQTENNIEETGIVDTNTAIKLKEKYNERDNER
jgi:peptidoglycan hydrolase-like protein with peptidoglycan-binding domain